MNSIKLNKKDSDKILKKMKKAGIKKLPKQLKGIRFHKDFDKGERLAVCTNCGYPIIFFGLPVSSCCDFPKLKIFPRNRLVDFILEMQKIMEAKKWNWKNP